MGDAGALFLGALVASLAVRLKPTSGLGNLSILIPIFLIAVPMLDTTVAVFSRISRGLSPFTGGKDHLSHRLIREGLTKRIAVSLLWILTFVFGVISLSINSNILNSTFLASLGGIFWIGLFVYFFTRSHE